MGFQPTRHQRRTGVPAMRASLSALLTRAADYAAVLAPYNRPVESAMQDYLNWRLRPEGFVVGCFVCPAEKLSELARRCAGLLSGDMPCRLAAVGREDPLSPELIRDIRLLDEFVRSFRANTALEAFESRFSCETLGEWEADDLVEGLNVLATTLVERHFGALRVFLEPPAAGEPKTMISRAIEILGRHNVGRGEPAPTRIGLRLSVNDPQTPSALGAEDLASAMIACREASVPLKIAGELHHALPAANGYGVLNVLAAGVIAASCEVNESELAALLRTDDPGAFTFDEEGLAWGGLRVSISEIETARRELIVCVATGRFNELVAGLKALRLL
jgi:hypothetical protein